ncbi:unnamed protein product [Leptosia nina]|uniref:Zinc finger protein 865 n=1 Tax=Leptosia nina TaxID=320188 RepID=A0AAV1J5I3_9NEOP
MEVYLYNSSVCRLCGEENDNGTLLYTDDENNQTLNEIINTYLPLKVSDDGQLPRTICPGCTIQLEATVEFFNLIINGQKIIRDLHEREIEYKKNLAISEVSDSEVLAENIVYEINTSDGVYHVEHPISLQMAGLDKPKRKRGRPSKKSKSPEEIAQEAAAAVAAQEKEARQRAERAQEENHGKRRRKTPSRLRETVQGRELEKIFIEEGVIDKAESEPDVALKEESQESKQPYIKLIGHVANSGEPVLLQRGKGRGRPRGVGRSRLSPSQCAQCGMQFSTSGRYMSHIAMHKANPLFNPTPPNNSVENLEVADTQPKVPKEEMSNENIAENDDKEHPGREQANNCDKSSNPNTTEDKTKSPGNEADGETAVSRKKLKCNYCDKEFSTRQSKSMHIKAVHKLERPYTCKECGQSFPYPRSLALHTIAHRRHRAAAGYACDICGKILSHPSSVLYHKQSVHSRERYVCGACGKTFHHRQLLQRHQLVHSADRPYQCDICMATFKTKPNLQNHHMLHTGIKKFSCSLCSQRFSHKTTFTLHMRMHTGTKPFACGTCGKSFCQKGNLTEHERIHTGEKPFVCDVCPRRFTTSSQRRLHTIRHHLRGDTADINVSHQEPLPVIRQEKEKSSQAGVNEHSLLVKRSYQTPAKINKKMSLLVNGETPTIHQDAEPVPDSSPGGDDDVIYVAYDVDNEKSSTFHIINSEEVTNLDNEKVLATCELYTGPSIVAQEDVEVELGQEHFATLQNEQVQIIRGQAPSPLHFRMQDGTMLTVASLDGETLQILTQDGDSIPVEVNEYEGETENATQDSLQSLPEVNRRSVSTIDKPTQYFTIV